MVFRYGSVCSGIEAVSVAWQGMGFEPAWFSEIEPFPCAVLAHHYPRDCKDSPITTRESHGEIRRLNNAQTRRATWQSETVWQFRLCDGLGVE